MLSNFRKKLDDIFLNHPRGAGETYLQHLCFTLNYAFKLLALSLCLFIHGLIPALFANTTSQSIMKLNAVLEERRK